MATAPERVRRALLRVTDAAQAELRAVVAAAPEDPAGWRATLFATAPLIVSEYSPGASTLALDWFEEIRAEARPRSLYRPTPRLSVTDDDVSAMVARVTESLREGERFIEAETERLMAEANRLLEAEMQKTVASGFRDTMTGNTADDPAAVGWQRFTRPDGCKFCRMLADRGAVFTESTVRFAAHTNCNCVVGQSYDPDAPRADVMQFLASQRTRSDAERARLREYLNHNFPDAPG